MKSILRVVLMLLVASVPAWAALGDSVSSVDTDTQALNGTHVMVAKVGYNLHQITMKDGSVVNEYASPAGVIFGVSWRSHITPNLSFLLGTYYTNYQQGTVVRRIPRRAITIEGDNFVFSSAGHMRSFSGRAYVPGLVPANLTAEVVQ
jgi:hypothetical protein